MLLPLGRIGRSCWTRKKGARTLTANSRSKSSTRRFLYRRRFRHAGVGDKDIEAVSDDLARPLCQLVWPVGRREVDADRVRVSAALAN